MSLKAVEWSAKTGLNRRRPMRTVKMIAAVCSECQAAGPGWWTACPHDPWHGMQAIEDPSGRFTEQKDGTFTEDTRKAQTIKSYRKVPNVRQVPLSIRVDSGLSVESALAKGWRMPADVDPGDGENSGYAPMCEFENCYAPNPQVSTRHSLLADSELKAMLPRSRFTGHYCSDDHARRARLRDSEMVRYVPEVNKASAKSARMQLDAIVI